MKSAIDAVKEYLEAKGIRFEAGRENSVWFSLLIPTPEIAEMPNRLVSCGIRIPDVGDKALHFSATVMAIELSDELLAPVTSFFMRFQSLELKAGRIIVHPDGSVFYHHTQFLCSGGSSDMHAVAAMITTAILEIAAIFLAKDDVLRILPTATVPRFGVA
jgi:hypothetical protein